MNAAQCVFIIQNKEKMSFYLLSKKAESVKPDDIVATIPKSLEAELQEVKVWKKRRRERYGLVLPSCIKN